MDVLAHSLWTNFMFRVIPQTRNERKLAWWGTAFGVLPDVVSFTPVFGLFFYKWITGQAQWVMGRPDPGNFPLQELTYHLYNYTHSFVPWIAATIIFWLALKKFPWILLGWGLHVATDIFSHSTEFFPTPYLFPFRYPTVNGIPWAHPTFMAINYGLLAMIYLVVVPVWKRKLRLRAQR
jgi:hypothetical protein